MDVSTRDFRWKVVGAVFVIAAMTWGVGLYGITTMLAALKATRGWSTTTLSAAVSLHYLTSAVLVLLLSRAHDLLGIARVTQIGAAVMAVGIMAWAHATAPWHLALAALLTGMAWAATGTAAITAMVSAWFDQDRPRALGTALNGISVGGLLFAPAWPFAINGLGISHASIAVGVAACLTICVLASFFLTPVGPHSRQRVRPAVPVARADRGVVLPTWKFQSVAVAFGISLLASMGILIHLTTYLAASWGLAAAGLAVGLVTVSTIVGRIVLGWWLHKLGLRASAALCFLVSAAGSALLTAVSAPVLVLMGCSLFGLGGAGLNLLPALIAQREYPAEVTPMVVGFFGSTAQLSVTIAPFAMGALSQLFGAYYWPFLMAALIQLAGSLLILSYREPAACR